MSYRVEIAPLAFMDLASIRSWISEAVDHDVASSYIDRIEHRIAALVDFPHRGTPRDDLGAGVRTLSFERKVRIVYRVRDKVVRIERVVSVRRQLLASL